MENASSCGINPIAALVMNAKGFSDSESVMEFLKDPDDLCDPFLFTDMRKAVDRIVTAVEKCEKIVVYGDYDVDGVTSVALLYSYLQMRGADVGFYIPDREREGYGLNLGAIDKLAGDGVKLIVTVDNGIVAVDEIAHAAELGIDVVVTDHHLPGERLPNAVAVVDPHRSDCNLKFRDYAGVGVAFKLVCAMEDGGLQDVLYEYADLVALGTIADVVPLKDENRYLCKYGIRRINEFSRPGIESLRLMSKSDQREIDSTDIAYGIVPKLNAAGRMGDASASVYLLTGRDLEETDQYIEYLQKTNIARREEEMRCFQEAEKQLMSDGMAVYAPVIVVHGEGWHPGVIGIVAARLCSATGKPAIVFTLVGDEAKGSCRSIDGFDIYKLLSGGREMYLHFGGHKMAAGVTIRRDDVGKFTDYVMNEAVKTGIPADTLFLDAIVKPERINMDTVNALDVLKPFGCCNERPVFGVRSVKITGITELSGGKHTKLTVMGKGGSSFDAVLFGRATHSFEYSIGDTVDLAVQLDRSIYGGRTYLSVVVKEIRLSSFDADALHEQIVMYEKYKTGQKLSVSQLVEMLPDRKDFEDVYRFVRKFAGLDTTYETVNTRLANLGIKYCKMRVILDIFKELDIINSQEKLSSVCFMLPDKAKKVDLNDSKLWEELKNTYRSEFRHV